MTELTAAQIDHNARNAQAKLEAAQLKAARIAAHEQRNARLKIEGQQRKEDRLEAHLKRNAEAAFDAAMNKAAKALTKPAAVKVAEAAPAAVGVAANDDGAVLQAAA